MSVTPHPELPGYYRSSYGGWEFSLSEDGNLQEVAESILAWTEWQTFLVKRAEPEQETLF